MIVLDTQFRLFKGKGFEQVFGRRTVERKISDMTT